MKSPNFLNRILLIVLFAFIISGSPQDAVASTQLNENVTIRFTNMNPHVNQNLYLRIVDKGTMKETARSVHLISTADFDITLSAVDIGRSYYIDFFADFNTNGLYDVPPTDHAWRLELDNAAGNDTLNFSHNTNFTNIDWAYQVVVHFTGMSPHLNQMLELRVEDNNSELEVDRIKLNSIPAANFDITIIGTKLNTEYKVEFYADLNGNGLYDEPPADHAWLLTFENLTGDVELDFSHNTNFDDINWKYLLTFDLMNMVPHLGQLFELRVVKTDDSSEIGRRSLTSILVKDFTLFVDGLEVGHDYNIDFYADHNGNGQYDAPPADHAWRTNITNVPGDVNQQFTHNTSFTDIQWPNPSSVEKKDGVIADSYNLLQNYPNPFNPTTKIKFTLSEQSFVTLKVFDILGNEIAILVNERLDSGVYETSFDAVNFISGVYFYSLQTEKFVQTKKMTLIK
jgi:hypothetical protein